MELKPFPASLGLVCNPARACCSSRSMGRVIAASAFDEKILVEFDAVIVNSRDIGQSSVSKVGSNDKWPK